MNAEDLKLIGVRYIKDVYYEKIEDYDDEDGYVVEHDKDDLGPIVHITRFNSFRPRIYPVGCVALFQTPEGTRIMSYSLCGEQDRDSFSRDEAKNVARTRALSIAECDVEYLKSILGNSFTQEILEGVSSERVLFLTNSDINIFPSHLRRDVIIAEYDLFKDIDMAYARSEGILPKINRKEEEA